MWWVLFVLCVDEDREVDELVVYKINDRFLKWEVIVRYILSWFCDGIWFGLWDFFY